MIKLKYWKFSQLFELLGYGVIPKKHKVSWDYNQTNGKWNLFGTRWKNLKSHLFGTDGKVKINIGFDLGWIADH